MSKADKRERQRQNRELARQERERLMKRDRRMRSARGLLFVLVPIIAVIVIYSLVKGDDSSSAATKQNGCTKVTSSKLPTKDTSQKAPAMTIDPNKTYTAKIATSCGTMTVDLDAKTAPIATNNFVSLAKEGFYDGLPFHRAAKDFVIQGGDPKGDGSGGPGYSVKGEVPTDHYPVGALAAAKSGGAPAGDFGSQFFIVTGAQGATLPNDYARFGNVSSGISVAKKIGSFAPSNGDGPPTQKVLIDKITISES
ncbi:MAG TPA: peptidylprolyl isomerase [Acidimicrobiia bacterium]